MVSQPVPIYSTRDDDYELEDEISQFAVGVAERVDALQDAESTGDLKQLGGLADELGERSEALGFPGMAGVARSLSRACRDDKPEAAQQALVELTNLAQRVRLGHRGAA